MMVSLYNATSTAASTICANITDALTITYSIKTINFQLYIFTGLDYWNGIFLVFTNVVVGLFHFC